MTDLYVLDAHCLLALQGMELAPQVLNRILDEMTELVKTERVCFPTPVIKFCREYATDEIVTTWVNAVAGYRLKKTVQATYQSEVLDGCEDILDPDDPEEPVGLLVAAMYLELQQSCEPVVVTEDVRPQPTRTCLRDACALLDISTISLAGFLAAEIVTPIG